MVPISLIRFIRQRSRVLSRLNEDVVRLYYLRDETLVGRQFPNRRLKKKKREERGEKKTMKFIAKKKRGPRI